MKLTNMLLSLSLTITLASCASNDSKNEKNPFDALTLKEVLVEGKTTQADILTHFGAPDMTAEDASKNDLWVYSKHKNESESNGIAGGALAFLPGPFSLAGGMISNDKSESASKTVTLTLYFNKQKKLKNYSLTKIRI